MPPRQESPHLTAIPQLRTPIRRKITQNAADLAIVGRLGPRLLSLRHRPPSQCISDMQQSCTARIRYRANQQPAFLYLYVALLAPLAQMQNVPKLERIFPAKLLLESIMGAL